jgi:hypothetical protein
MNANLATVTAAGATALCFCELSWYAYLAQAGAQVAVSGGGVDSFNKALGVWATSNGGTASGQATIYATPSLLGGLGALDIYFRVAFAALPSAASLTTFRFGISDAIASYNNHISVFMGFSGSACGWSAQCVKAGTSTGGTAYQPNPTIIALTSLALSFYKIKIRISAAWDSVTFFVNGVQIGSAITTNIPTVAMYLYAAGDRGNAGSANGFYIDNAFIDYQYATP